MKNLFCGIYFFLIFFLTNLSYGDTTSTALTSAEVQTEKDETLREKPDNKYLEKAIPYFNKKYPNEKVSFYYCQCEFDINSEYFVLTVAAQCKTAKIKVNKQITGIFIVQKKTEEIYMNVAFHENKFFDDYSVEYADSEKIIIALIGNYGKIGEKMKIFYDLKNKKTEKLFIYKPVYFYDVAEDAERLFFIGSNNYGWNIKEVTNNIIFSVNANQDIIKTISSFPISDIIENVKIPFIYYKKVQNSGFVLHALKYDFVYSEGKWKKYNNDNSSRCKNDYIKEELEFSDSLKRSRYIVSGDDEKHGITEIRNKTKKFYKYPAPDYTEYLKLRKGSCSSSDSDEYTLDNHIGPFQCYDDIIYFGVKFYDGEGFCGYGGFGSFDLKTKKYNITTNEILCSYSCSAILLDDTFCWMGLYFWGEGEWPGGLARINRKDSTIIKFDVKHIINKIYKIKGKIYLITYDGIYIIENNENLKYIRFSPDKKGKIQAELG